LYDLSVAHPETGSNDCELIFEATECCLNQITQPPYPKTTTLLQMIRGSESRGGIPSSLSCWDYIRSRTIEQKSSMDGGAGVTKRNGTGRSDALNGTAYIFEVVAKPQSF
jgi:hypothetical protein